MSGWKAKRFWKQANAVATAGGWTVQLDGRPVKTPAKALLVVPTQALADALAGEWNAQTEMVKPETMPVTRPANSAIDKVAVQFHEVAALIAAYGGSDLLCYRATFPEDLQKRQAQAWDPLLEWAATVLDAPLKVAQGVMPIEQPAHSQTKLAAQVQACTPFELAALHDLVAISGSLILGLAVCKGRLTPETAWQLSRIDESYQNEVWGTDDEAAAAESVRRAGFAEAARFWTLARDPA